MISHVIDTNMTKNYPTEFLNFCDVVFEDIWLCSLVKAVELGNIVHLNIIVDTINKSRVGQLAFEYISRFMHVYSLPKSSRTVTIVVSAFQVLGVVKLKTIV